MTDRNKTIDIAKLLCLTLMVFCHIPPIEDGFHQVVYSFHMPFFFFVGGLCYNPERFDFQKGFRTLLIPYLCFNILILVLSCGLCLISNSFDMSIIGRGLLGIIVGSNRGVLEETLPSTPTWFLLAYFFVKISAKYILKCKLWMQCLLILAPIIFVLMFRHNWTWCLWSLDSAVLGSVFFYPAYYLKNHILSLFDSKKTPWLVFVTLPLCCLSVNNGQVDMWAGKWGNSFPLYFVFGLIGVVNILLVSKLIRLPNKLLGIFLDGSVFILCMNTRLIAYFMLFARKVMHFSGDFLWYHKLPIVALVVIITLICTPPIMKYIPWLLGKERKTV